MLGEINLLLSKELFSQSPLSRHKMPSRRKTNETYAPVMDIQGVNQSENLQKRFYNQGNNPRLFFQLTLFTLIAIMSLFSGQTLAQTPTPTPTTSTTVTEGDLFPGGIVSFGVSSGPGSVTVDHVNAGTGLQSLTVVGVPTNAVVNIPAFVPGTLAPVVVTYTAIDPNLPVNFSLRAASTFHAIFIAVRCNGCVPDACFATAIFSNSGLISIPGSGTAGNASPYPSTINVGALSGYVTKVTVQLNLSHAFPDDIDVMLVGPNGQGVILMSDVGGSIPVSGRTLTFDSTVLPMLPDNGPLLGGTFKPTNIGEGDFFPPPAPSPPIFTSLSIFNAGNPMGMWRLYVFDDKVSNTGTIQGGWTLSITRNFCSSTL